MNETTLFIFQLIGPMMLIMGLGMLLNQKLYVKLFEETENPQPYHIFISTSIALTIGLLIVLNHNIWTTTEEIIVSLIGWIALVEGILLAIIPEFFKSITKFLKINIQIYGIIVIILSFYFLYVGFYI